MGWGSNGCMHQSGISGVIGDGACKQISQGTWETRRNGPRYAEANAGWESITVSRFRRESEGSIVARKRLTPVERRDPTENMFP